MVRQESPADGPPQNDVDDVPPELPTEGNGTPQFLRSEYIDHLYACDFLPPDSMCGGRTCKTLQALREENSIQPGNANGHGAAAGGATQTPLFRCRDCIGGRVFCQDCVILIHDTMPLHRIERWNGSFYERQSPTEPQAHQLMYLGHNGSRCRAQYRAAHAKRPTESTLTVVHTNGYHKLQVVYCNCLGSPEPHVQLLYAGLFPATHTRPATAFTFQLLKHFQRFNLASKTAVYDYHKALLQLTDFVLPQSIPVSSFFRILR